MTRYIAVPVEYYEWNGKVCAKLTCTCTHADDRVDGYGSTEDEAFSDLLTKLGYEEAKVVHPMAKAIDDIMSNYDVDEVARKLKRFIDEAEKCSEEEEK